MRVAASGPLDAFQNGREVAVAVEDHDGSLGVAPAEIVEQLIDRLGQAFRPRPEFEFRNEDVFVLNADQDVGLAAVVECLPGCRSVKTPVQLNEKMLPQILFAHRGECRRTSLHDVSHALHDIQNEMIVFFVEDRFGLDCRLCLSRHDRFPDRGRLMGLRRVGADFQRIFETRHHGAILLQLGKALADARMRGGMESAGKSRSVEKQKARYFSICARAASNRLLTWSAVTLAAATCTVREFFSDNCPWGMQIVVARLECEIFPVPGKRNLKRINASHHRMAGIDIVEIRHKGGWNESSYCPAPASSLLRKGRTGAY